MTRSGLGSMASGAAVLAALLSPGGCGALSGQGASPYPQAVAGTPAGPPRPLDRAAADLADALLTRAGAADGRRFALVVDPFVDRSTGNETAATRAAVATIAERVRARHPSAREAIMADARITAVYRGERAEFRSRLDAAVTKVCRPTYQGGRTPFEYVRRCYVGTRASLVEPRAKAIAASKLKVAAAPVIVVAAR